MEWSACREVVNLFVLFLRDYERSLLNIWKMASHISYIQKVSLVKLWQHTDSA